MSISITTTSTGEALTTVAAVKEHLGIIGSSDDVRLGVLVDSASAAIASYCGRTFGRATYLETLPGYGGALLQLARTPIRSVATVTLRGESITDYAVEDADAGWLYRERGWEWTNSVNWSLSDRIVSGGELPLFAVTYQAGYLLAGTATSEARTLPSDLEQAAIETIKSWRAAANRDPSISSKRLGPLSVTYGTLMNEAPLEALPVTARALCRPYRRSAIVT